MASKDWEIDVSWTYGIENAVSEGMLDVCIGSAERALFLAKDYIPSPEGPAQSRGLFAEVPDDWSTGALKASGYVISKRGSGYRAAIREAKGKYGTAIVRRNQVMAQFPIEMFDIRNKAKAVAAMDFPLTYATLLQKGFYHSGAQKQVIGIDYIASAMNQVDDEFHAAMRRVLASAMKKQPRLKLRGY